ncbi:hypothetical protein SNE25_11520 [Mucilaginibacter sabulilitoris]|uniref:DUF4625 domain-containing protein n=1 Tax=Mucilaginibacter sabulilitoris TaxID=1173583 RepID=A0ABZ0TSR2_9SPHI|nr:hypothetical protein [Mucilaginibacter sabulilitoris]WPU96149.1 hypothetical protein SNE25_11520 [Mucilaginibacter sabulilitoris]
MKAIKMALVSVIILLQLSCSKEKSVNNPLSNRVIRFELYAKKDNSDNNHNITFSLFIKSHKKVLFDSTLAVMKIKDIPDSTQKLVFEKKVPDDDGSELAAGFRYVIEGVGNSSHLDVCRAGESFKLIEFPFQ